MIPSNEEIEQSIEENLEKLRDGDIEPSEAVSNILLSANGLPTNIGDISSFYSETSEEESASIARSITNLTDKGNESKEIAELINTLSYTQIQPSNDKYIDSPSEAEEAVDIGRRILKREKKGGRPSKVDKSIEQINKYIKWHNGEQQTQFITREIKRSKKRMSRPTWNKFKNQANELLTNELNRDIEYYL